MMESSTLIDAGFVRGVITALNLAAFLGVCAWAYAGRNRKRFEADALLPFEDEAPGERDREGGCR